MGEIKFHVYNMHPHSPTLSIVPNMNVTAWIHGQLSTRLSAR